MIRKQWVLLSMFTALLLVAAVTIPVVADEGKDEARGKEKHGKDKRGPKAHDWDDRGYDTYFERHGYTHLDIPPGHLPPPGACRVWYPGKPPGHQPPPGQCGRLRYRVPAGAWLIQRPYDEPEHVDISVYDIHAIGIFAVDTGAFIRPGIVIPHRRQGNWVCAILGEGRRRGASPQIPAPQRPGPSLAFRKHPPACPSHPTP